MRKLRCTCTHDFQDKRYGRKVRIHNRKGSNGKWGRTADGWRCTVCGNVKPVIR